MILVDTSVWIDHFRARDTALVSLLEEKSVLIHPFVLGEIALGVLRQRAVVLAMLSRLPAAIAASDPEVLTFIDRHRLFGAGIGYVDAHLLASVRLSAGAKLWTRDGHLAGAAERLGVSADLL